MNNINDKKYKEYKKKKVFRYLFIILSFLTIILESLALFKMISYLWGLIPFVICYIIKYLSLEKETKKKNNKSKKDDRKWSFFNLKTNIYN